MKERKEGRSEGQMDQETRTTKIHGIHNNSLYVCVCVCGWVGGCVCARARVCLCVWGGGGGWVGGWLFARARVCVCVCVSVFVCE